MKMQKGFTLMEVMVAVVIVAILAMVAIPSYQDYMIRGKVVQATSGLSDGRIKMEQFFQDNRTYEGAEVRCPAPTEFFTFGCVNDASTYTLTANGRNGLEAYTYSIDQSNVRRSITPFSENVEVTCWLLNKGDAC